MRPAEMFSHWELVRKGTLETIGLFRENELTYRPVKDTWSAGQIMVHIANAEEGWFRYAVTRELPEWPEHLKFENYPSKMDILNLLNDVHDRTAMYLGSLSEAGLTAELSMPWGQKLSLQWIIWHVIEHEIHHRGELSLILGLLGREGLEV